MITSTDPLFVKSKSTNVITKGKGKGKCTQYSYTVWVKKYLPEVFWHFSQTVGNF